MSSTVDGLDNRAARISGGAAAVGVAAATGNLVTGTMFLPLTLGWVFLILVCSMVAIISGHIGRRRARRHGLPGRWLALASIVAAYLTFLYALLVTLLFFGVLIGLHALFNS
ncbi:DUF4190 domain-containing protein [Streptomyces violascens]|uniref:DUF4190 domain-containing protein n=1 Tax=Streptomyces violascens TaxID=67381 RepID=UPI003676F5B8